MAASIGIADFGFVKTAAAPLLCRGPGDVGTDDEGTVIEAGAARRVAGNKRPVAAQFTS
jgi:hypothetical protein